MTGAILLAEAVAENCRAREATREWTSVVVVVVLVAREDTEEERVKHASFCMGMFGFRRLTQTDKQPPLDYYLTYYVRLAYGGIGDRGIGGKERGGGCLDWSDVLLELLQADDCSFFTLYSAAADYQAGLELGVEEYYYQTREWEFTSLFQSKLLL